MLVVGGGNTGAEIALDLAEHGATPTLCVRTPVNVVPRDFLGIPAQVTSLRMRSLPLAMRDQVGRWASWLTFGDLSRYGLPPPALGPISSVLLRGRIPIIDVGTVDAIKRGAIAVKPGVARCTARGAIFADGSEEASTPSSRRPAISRRSPASSTSLACSMPGAIPGAGRPMGPGASTSWVTTTSRLACFARSAVRPRPLPPMSSQRCFVVNCRRYPRSSHAPAESLPCPATHRWSCTWITPRSTSSALQPIQKEACDERQA